MYEEEYDDFPFCLFQGIRMYLNGDSSQFTDLKIANKIQDGETYKYKWIRDLVNLRR
ncbi:unnamed protein product [Paramecium sonneborni]|uniref:Uncharacterized protein n=1 Tax=Paramecium sonneborni TaxID=65129 RepID=A0A8S1R5B1_9CILI|nr:unnamed protein product [Paramecium sonneborni]